MSGDQLNNKPEEGFTVVEHTADWSIRVVGQDLRQLFTNAALGMNSLLFEDLQSIGDEVQRELALEAYDGEGLLVDWLSELAFWAETEQLLFPHIEIVEISPVSMRARLRGGPAPELHKHIKAVTYHNLEIAEREFGFTVTIVFDV